MCKCKLALFVLTATFAGCDSQNSASTGTAAENPREAQSGNVEAQMPSWVKTLDRSAMSLTDFDGPGRSIEDLAEQISRDDEHVAVLRRVLEACNQDEADTAVRALTVITKKDPNPEYLELSDVLLSRQGSLQVADTCWLFADYSVETVIDRLVKILTGENASRLERFSVVRVLDMMLERDGCELVRPHLDGVTRLILDESDDSRLVIETMILRRTCDLISNADCLERLDAILAREGSDFSPHATRKIRELCADD